MLMNSKMLAKCPPQWCTTSKMRPPPPLAAAGMMQSYQSLDNTYKQQLINKLLAPELNAWHDVPHTRIQTRVA
jgi:hypothetical protein